VSGMKRSGNGHIYFTLKDAEGQLDCVLFSREASRLKFSLEEGMAVRCRGRLTLYEARGSYQMNVQWMEPLGLGSLQLAFDQLKEKLRAEGLFDEARKRPIPALPRRVGLVTSPTGAAVRDFLRVLERRHAGVRVLIVPCRVQGDTAAREVATAIATLNRIGSRMAPPVDVIVLARGGGSLEDLWAFNEEVVARAIAASELPVVSAIGHEVDVTISDFVADLRAPTPSAAAEMLVRSRAEMMQQVSAARARLTQAIRYGILRRRSRAEGLARRRGFQRVEASVRELRQRSDEAAMRLGNALLETLRRGRLRVGTAQERLSPRGLRAELLGRRHRLTAAASGLTRAARDRCRSLRETLDGRAALLRSLSPLSVLDRGYALVQDGETGRVITSSESVAPGDAVHVRLARGRLEATVDRVQGPDAADAPETSGGPGSPKAPEAPGGPRRKGGGRGTRE
jgi:exodeoxyribonuclease VII large subunit